MALGIQELPFSKMRGIHTRKAIVAQSPEEALSCVGGFFDIEGGFTKRRGGEKYNTTALSDPINAIYDFRYSNDTLQKILIASGTDIYQGNGGVPTSILSGLTDGTYPDFITYLDHAWFVNGADGMYKYDGTTASNAGIARPGATTTALHPPGGTLAAGNYKVAVTFVNALGEESNPSDILDVNGVALNDQIDLSNIPISADPQVTTKNIYTTDVGGALLKFHGSIANGVTIYTIEDVLNLGALLEYDHDAPPDGLIGIEVHKDRIFGFKDATIYFSKDFDVWYWPQGELDQEQIFTIDVGNSDPITGLKTFYDVLLIFKKYDVYVLSGDNELNFRVDRVRSDERVGTVSDRSIKIIGNYCYFLGVNSVYRTNGITVEEVGDPIGDFFDQNSSSTVYKINKNYFQFACAEYYKELNLYLLFVPTGASTLNNMCFAMQTNSIRIDQETGKITADWMPWPGFTTQSVAIIVENGVEKWWRGEELGFVYKQEALNGDGSNITSTSTGGNGAATLNDTAQAWTVDLYVGVRVNILRGTGAGQERIITSNTATELTVNSNWAVIPDETSVYAIGGIPYHYQHSWNNYGSRSHSKRWRYARPLFQTSGNYQVDLFYGFDFATVDTDSFAYMINGVALWDAAFWDVDTWDGTAILQSKLPIPGNRIHRWSNLKIENNGAGQPVSYFGCDKLFQVKGIR